MFLHVLRVLNIVFREHIPWSCARTSYPAVLPRLPEQGCAQVELAARGDHQSSTATASTRNDINS